MPRTTNKQYLTYRHWLVAAWNDEAHYYHYLSPTAQWHLHGYFRPSEQLTTEQSLEHRKQVSAEWPALPQQAGRAFKKILRIYLADQATPPPEPPAKPFKHRKVTNVIALPLVKPKPDPEKLARALIAVARELHASPRQRGSRFAAPSQRRSPSAGRSSRSTNH